MRPRGRAVAVSRGECVGQQGKERNCEHRGIRPGVRRIGTAFHEADNGPEAVRHPNLGEGPDPDHRAGTGEGIRTMAVEKECTQGRRSKGGTDIRCQKDQRKGQVKQVMRTESFRIVAIAIKARTLVPPRLADEAPLVNHAFIVKFAASPDGAVPRPRRGPPRTILIGGGPRGKPESSDCGRPLKERGPSIERPSPGRRPSSPHPSWLRPSWASSFFSSLASSFLGSSFFSSLASSFLGSSFFSLASSFLGSSFLGSSFLGSSFLASAAALLALRTASMWRFRMAALARRGS